MTYRVWARVECPRTGTCALWPRLCFWLDLDRWTGAPWLSECPAVSALECQDSGTGKEGNQPVSLFLFSFFLTLYKAETFIS